MTGDRQFLGSFPYAGTSGYAAGSPTSEARARDEDAKGTTTLRQSETLARVRLHGRFGMTVRELRAVTGWHHGQASSVLSVLHKEGRLARLTESRNRCRVYVTTENVDGRDTEPHGSANRPAARFVLDSEAITAALAEAGLEGRDAARARNALRALGVEVAR